MTKPVLANRHVLVTGAGSGIGAAIAARLAREGARVTLAGRRREPLEAVAATLGTGNTHILAGFDVTDRTAIDAGLQSARATFGPVGILVNNAGEAPSAPFEKTSADMWNHVMAVDLGGVFNVTQAVLPDLKAGGEGGRIINIASTAGLTGYAYVSAYCAAKHGVVGLTRALALELAKRASPSMRSAPALPIRRSSPVPSKKSCKNRTHTGRSAWRIREGQSARTADQAGRSSRHGILAGITRRAVDQWTGDCNRRWGGHGRMSDNHISMASNLKPFKDYQAKHFLWEVSDDGRVATLTLNRPDRKNPLTFESYAELRDLFRDLVYASDVRTIVLSGAGGNFSSGGDVFEIIEPLTHMTMPDLLAFTRMTGDVMKAMRKCPQQIIAAVDGICAGAGAILAMASDLRLATPEAKTAFLFTRVGLAGADMGACGILPRIVGQGRAADLLYTGRFMSAEEGERWGFSMGFMHRPNCRKEHTQWRAPSPTVHGLPMA